MITREFNLYLHAGHSIPLVINANQYDRGEQWLFTLFNADGTQYVPSSGAIVGIKSDNLGIINSGTVDASGRVVINETQQMTAAVGKAVFELVIDDGTHGTANFVVLVEPKPGDNADLSESDISMIEEAVEAAANIKPYGSPLVASTVAGMTDHEKVYVYVGSETGYTSGHWYYYDGDSWEDGGVYNSVAVQTDTTLAISGMAADAKKTGDEISDLKSQITNSMPREVKLALDTMLLNMAVKDDDVYSDEYAVFHAWATAINLESISAVFTQGANVIYDTDSLNSLKQYLVVTATYDDQSTATITTYTLSGTLAEGTSTITATYEGVSTTFTVNVTRLELKVFVGKGTSGSSIVDNVNRALSAPVPFTNDKPLTIQYTDISNAKFSFKNTTPNTGTIDSSTTVLALADQIGKTQAEIGYALGNWGDTSNEYTLVSRASASAPYETYEFASSSGYMRVLMANIEDTSSPISGTIEGVIKINGVPYHLVESSDPFE